MAAMPAGLFFSRALLSVSMIAFIAASVLHLEVKQQGRDFLRNPLAVSMSVLFLVPLVSGLWSAGQSEWQTMMQVKLPLLLLPFAFAGLKTTDERDWQRLAVFFIGLTIGGTIWSFAGYLQHKAVIDHDYLHSQTLHTPLDDDHVRFSWMAAFSFLLAGYLLLRRKVVRPWLKTGLIIAMAWLAIYLHILSARTGLISLYAVVLLFAFWLVRYQSKKSTGLILLTAFFLVPVLAYTFLPTFRNRVKYFRYEFSFVKADNYRPGSNDGTRLASLRAGWHLLQQYPLSGAGFGDIYAETVSFYKKEYPAMPPENYIYPSGQYMMYGAGTGWPGLAIYMVMILLPFFMAGFRQHPEWWMLQTISVISLLPDNPLELQFGVFLYAFVLLWCRDWWFKKAVPGYD